MDSPVWFLLFLVVAVVIGRLVWSSGKGPDKATMERAVREYPTPSPGQATVVRRYSGSQATATRLYEGDAARLGRMGYRPTSVQWTPGQYSPAAFMVALILCVLLIGILIFIYMLIVKPPGSLAVTYHLDQAAPLGGQGPAQPAASIASGHAVAPGLAERLAQLASARDAGWISSQEHDAKRAELLAQF